MEKEIADLEAELNPLMKHAQLLARRQNRLETEISTKQTQISNYERLLSSRRDVFSKTLHPRLNHRISQLDRLSTNLDSAESQIVEIVSSAVSNAGSTQPSPFISTSSWTDYHNQEDLFARQVRLYMKRLLPDSESDSAKSSGSNVENRSDMLDDAAETSRYHWLNVADPKQVQFRGVDAATHARHSNELKRLRELFAPSESARTLAELELARKNAEVETLKLQSHQPLSHLDDLMFKQKSRELQKKHQKIKTLLARNLETILPELYAELAKLQSTPILWADYNLKLSRLHLKRVKIDHVVSSLLKHRSKSLLVSHLLEDEKKQHVMLYTLLNAISNDTTQIARHWNARRQILQNRVSTPANPPHLATLSLISQLLDAGLHFNSNRFAKALAKLREKKSGESASQIEAIELEKMKKSIKALYKMLYANSATKQPMLTPPEVNEQCRKLEASTGVLATSMESILKEFSGKSKVISELPKELQFERKLWTLFFTGRSAALKTAFDDLQAKIKTSATVKLEQ